MQVLVCLVENAGQVVSREELEEQVWPEAIVTEDAVTNAIAKLRRAFGENARRARLIETIPKVGYRLTVSAEPIGVAELAGSPNEQVPSPVGMMGNASIAKWVTAAAILAMFLFAAFKLVSGLTPSTAPAIRARTGPAVAVLTFKNFGASPEQDYFARGIADDLITDLVKVSGLTTIARRSVDYFKDASARPRLISNQLGADFLVDGSVQRRGDFLRVNVQLIEGQPERVIWGKRYEGSVKDIFEIQNALTKEVLAALKVRLTTDETDLLAIRPTNSIAAYDEYLQGIDEQGHRTRETNQAAKEHLRRALELDPKFARAYAGLAMAHSRDAIDGWASDPMQSLQKAKEFAVKASEIDFSIPQVHFVMGQVELFRREHVKAIEAARRAIEDNPNYADAYALSAWILNYAGRPREALANMNEAIRLNATHSASYLEVLGEIQFVQKQYDKATSTFRRVLDINPAYMRARMWLVASLALAGDVDGASWEVSELLVLEPDFDLDRLEFAFPFKDPRELSTLLHGLELAGLKN